MHYPGLLNVAGEEEEKPGLGAFDNAARRDTTALTIVEVETRASSGQRELPLSRVADRMAWTGVRHVALHAQLVDLARNVWGLSALAVDATGVGTGLAAFLVDRLGQEPRRVVVEPFVFTGKSKSDLGWAYVALIDGGRVKEYADGGAEITRVFRQQLAACAYVVCRGRGGYCAGACRRGEGTTIC